jgi:hypothetical protein
MFTLHLNHNDLRTAALAVAEAARKRRRDDSLTRASRRLADRFSEVFPVALAKGEVTLDVQEDEALVLHSALLSASSGPLWYGSRTVTPPAPSTFRALARRMEV